MNKVILKGNLAADPELRQTASGKSTASFTVCCNRGKDKTADFIRCIAWDTTAAAICNYFTKGRPILIEGQWRTGSYEKDGQKVFTSDCWVDRFEFCDSSSGGQGTAPAPTGGPAAHGMDEVISDGELPF